MTRIACGVTGLAVLFGLLCPAGASAQNGAALYREHCSGCHDTGVDRAPARDALQTMSAERVLTALENGAMLSMAQPHVDRRPARPRPVPDRQVALGARPDDDAAATGHVHHVVSRLRRPAERLRQRWNGWGANTNNTRFQDGAGAGLTAAQVPRLKVKWAFGFPGDLDANAQPSIVGGRVFVGSSGGNVYSLDAATGCIRWFFQAKSCRARRGHHRPRSSGTPDRPRRRSSATWPATSTRSTPARARCIWTVKADAHPLARIVGSVVLHEGRLYVPVASAEETAGAPANYECCKFRGSVTALDAATGRQIWKTFTIDEDAADHEKCDGHAVVGTVGRRRLEQPGHRCPPQRLVRHDGRQLQRARVEHERRIRRDGPRHRADRLVEADDGRRRVEHRVPPGRHDKLSRHEGARLRLRVSADPRHAGQRQARARGRTEVRDGPRGRSGRSGEDSVAGPRRGRQHARRRAVGLGVRRRQRRTSRCRISSASSSRTASAATSTRKPAAACSRSISRPANVPGTRRRRRAAPARGAARRSRRRSPRSRASCSRDRSTATCAATPPRPARSSGTSTASARTRPSTKCPRAADRSTDPGPAIAGGMLFVNSGYARAGGMPGNVLLALSVDGQ